MNLCHVSSSTANCIAFRCTALHCISLHCIGLQGRKAVVVGTVGSLAALFGMKESAGHLGHFFGRQLGSGLALLATLLSPSLVAAGVVNGRGGNRHIHSDGW